MRFIFALSIFFVHASTADAIKFNEAQLLHQLQTKALQPVHPSFPYVIDLSEIIFNDDGSQLKNCFWELNDDRFLKESRSSTYVVGETEDVICLLFTTGRLDGPALSLFYSKNDLPDECVVNCSSVIAAFTKKLSETIKWFDKKKHAYTMSVAEIEAELDDLAKNKDLYTILDLEDEEIDEEFQDDLDGYSNFQPEYLKRVKDLEFMQKTLAPRVTPKVNQMIRLLREDESTKSYSSFQHWLVLKELELL